MDSTFIQWLVSQAGLGGIAALALWLNNKQANDAIRRERENSEQTREVNARLLQTIQENTKAVTGLQHTLERAVSNGGFGAGQGSGRP